MSHLFYVASAFILSAAAILLLTGWILLDFRARTRELDRMEREGMVRRAGRTTERRT